MKTDSSSLAIACAAWLAATACAHGQGTALTYQGKLNNGANPASGLYDLKFTLFDVASGGSPVAGPRTNSATTVDSAGLFTVVLDFGVGVFTGGERWLEIGARTNGGGGFATLSPRQLLSAAPYSISAGNLTGTLPAAQLTGALGSDQLSGTYSGTVMFNNPANVFAGGGSGLTGLVSTNVLWFGCPPWSVCGNAGTVAGVNFLGTTDYQPMEIRVNNTLALRVVPTTSVPNWIGGGSAGSATAGTIGGTIGGGNGNKLLTPAFATIGGGATNTIRSLSDYSTIGGGSANVIGSTSHRSTIAGGSANQVSDGAGTIGGGERNLVDWGDHATIGGGQSNRVGYYATGTAAFSVIGGGSRNFTLNALGTIGGGSANQCGANLASLVDGYASTIAGGVSNSANGTYGSIGGGSNNFIEVKVVCGSIAGGRLNLLQTNASYSAIGGGLRNLAAGTNSTIGGGGMNTNYSDASIIAGGTLNSILLNDWRNYLAVGGYGSTIGGGIQNMIKEGVAGNGVPGQFNTISGGATNSLEGDLDGHAFGDTIGGGVANNMAGRTYYCTIGGGSDNKVRGGASHSSILGGAGNSINANGATVGGGVNNQIDCYLLPGLTIAGGQDNLIDGPSCDYATIGGGCANKVEGVAIGGVIPGGSSARVFNYGQYAFASGPFAAAGDAQTSTYVCRNTTTGGTQTELFLDGAWRRMTVRTNTTLSFDALVTGRTASGDSAGYRIVGCIENNSGTTALVGSPTVTILGEDVPAWDATLVADDTNDALEVRVTGAAATTIRWVASVRTVEVSF